MWLEGINYTFLRVEDDPKIVYAKKRGIGGVIMRATKTTIIIAHYPEGANTGYTSKSMGVIASYLRSVGY